jgi:hypothetical protein
MAREELDQKRQRRERAERESDGDQPLGKMQPH